MRAVELLCLASLRLALKAAGLTSGDTWYWAARSCMVGSAAWFRADQACRGVSGPVKGADKTRTPFPIRCLPLTPEVVC